MQEKKIIKLDSYLQEQWNASSFSIGSEDSMEMKMAIDAALASERTSTGSRRWPVLQKVSVYLCCACLAAVAVLGIALHREMAHDPSLCCISTEKGQRASMVLSDGTKIWLNSDSEVSFPSFEKADSRDIYLKGECYFEVAKDEKKPFIVHTDLYDVTAVGTAFNVRAYDFDEKVKTTLFEGKVLVKGNGIDTSLLPDEAVVYNRSNGKYSKVLSELSYYDALWRGNELVVSSGTTLEQLATILERNYNFQFRFSDEKIKEYTFGGVIKNCQFANVLDLICLSAPVSYKMDGDVVVFSRK